MKSHRCVRFDSSAIVRPGSSHSTLSFLAFVALAQLPTERSFLAFDELELYLHPSLLARVMNLMRMIAEKTPVLITIHSRRILDQLDNPSKSVAVLELEPETLSTTLDQLSLQMMLFCGSVPEEQLRTIVLHLRLDRATRTSVDSEARRFGHAVPSQFTSSGP